MRKQLQKQQRKPRFKQILIASRGKKKGKPTNIVIYHSHKNPNIGKVKFKLLNIGYTPGKISKTACKILTLPEWPPSPLFTYLLPALFPFIF